MWVVYSLMDPRDDSIFYVGITNNVCKRFIYHINGSGENIAKNMIISELRSDNRLPIMEELDRAETKELAEGRETYWIEFFLKSGDCLTNIQKAAKPFIPIKTPYRKYHVNSRIIKDDTVKLGVIDMYKHGANQKTIAQNFKMSQATVSRILAKHR